MSTIVTRAGKGSSLAWAEMDANLTNLNTDKVESSALGGSALLDVGTAAGTVAAGDHTHTGVYEPADATILKDADIDSTVLGYIAPGTSGNVLTSNGSDWTSAAAPSFAADAITGIGNGRATDITISSAGEVTMPLQPAFLAYKSANASNVTGDNTSYTVVCDAEVFDQNGDYNNGTGVFTAPVTGRYRFTARALVFELASAHVTQELNITTSNRSYLMQDAFGSNPYTQRQLEINVLADMDAGDTAYFAVVMRNGTKVCDVYGAATSNFTMFAGELVA